MLPESQIVQGPTDAGQLTGKFERCVHVSYDIFIGGADTLPDMTLTPSGPDDRLTILTFKDRIDGEAHHYVLNEEFRRAIVQGLTGGIEVPNIGR